MAGLGLEPGLSRGLSCGSASAGLGRSGASDADPKDRNKRGERGGGSPGLHRRNDDGGTERMRAGSTGPPRTRGVQLRARLGAGIHLEVAARLPVPPCGGSEHLQCARTTAAGGGRKRG